MKDDSLSSEPPPFFPNIFSELVIHDFACVSKSTYAPIVDHSKDTPDVGPSFDNIEDKLFIENPLHLSSIFARNTEDKFFRFSSTPLFDSSNHEDVDEIIDFSDHGSRGLFTPIFGHDHDSTTIDLSKPSVYVDLYNDEVETPKNFKEL